MKKRIVTVISVFAAVILLGLSVFAAGEGDEATSFWSWLQPLDGRNIALFGAFLAIFLSGWGSAKGVGIAGRTAAGVVAEDPSLSTKVLILEILPSTQGIYGFIIAFLIIVLKLDLFGGMPAISVADGFYYLIACLPIAIVGFVSAIHQAKVASAGMLMVAKQKDKSAMAMTYAALVELYAILALVISAFLVLFK